MASAAGQNPLISVLVPVYNSRQYIESALTSILQQTYRNIEIIIVDDGSDDGSVDYLEGGHDNRITVIKKANGGRATALNTALDRATGEFFCIQDGDDLSYPNRIEALLEAARARPHVAAVFSGYDIILDGERGAPIFNGKSEHECRNDIEAFKMPSHDATPLCRRSLIENLRFDEQLRIGSGMDFVLRLGELHPVVSVGRCLYTYRVHPRSTTRAHSELRKKMVSRVLISACRRRGLETPPPVLARQLRVEERDVAPSACYGLRDHLVESVFQLRARGDVRGAFRTLRLAIAVRSLGRARFHPVLFFVVPASLIRLYRWFKYLAFRSSFGEYQTRESIDVSMTTGKGD